MRAPLERAGKGIGRDLTTRACIPSTLRDHYADEIAVS